MKKFLELAAVLIPAIPVAYCYIGGMYGVKVPGLIANQPTGNLAFDNVVSLTTSGIIILAGFLAMMAVVSIACAIPPAAYALWKRKHK